VNVFDDDMIMMHGRARWWAVFYCTYITVMMILYIRVHLSVVVASGERLSSCVGHLTFD
jgi:hypothetical protein